MMWRRLRDAGEAMLISGRFAAVIGLKCEMMETEENKILSGEV